MGGIQAIQVCSPKRSELFVHGGSQTCALQFAQKILIRGVREAHVGGKKLLVENGRAQESRDLLLFHRVARQSNDVPDAGKDEAGDASFERLEEGNLSILKGQDGVGFSEFHAIFGGNRVDVLRINGQSIEGGEKFARGRIRCVANRRKKTPQNHQEETKPHEKSVVTFGMLGQGGRRSVPRRVKMNRCAAY